MSSVKYYFKVEGMVCSECEKIISAILTNPENLGNIFSHRTKVLDLKATASFNQGKLLITSDETLLDSELNALTVLLGECGFKSTLQTDAVTDVLQCYFECQFIPEGIKSTVEEKLKNCPDVREVYFSPSTNRMRVELNSAALNSTETKMLLKTKLETLEKRMQDLKIRAVRLKAQKVFQLHLKGLLPQQVPIIESVLEENKTDVDSYIVHGSVNKVTVNTRVRNDLDHGDCARLEQRIIEAILAVVDKTKVTVEKERAADQAEGVSRISRSFFKKAKVNLGFMLFFLLFNFLIPFQTALVGQALAGLFSMLTLGVMWYTGKEYYVSAWNNFRKYRMMNSSTMVALGTSIAWFYSVCVILSPFFFPGIGLAGHQFLAINMILGIVNFGRWIRARALEKSQKQCANLSRVYLNWLPHEARRLKLSPGVQWETEVGFPLEIVAFEQIEKGDILEILPGQRFPVEGEIISNKPIQVDQQVLTGESVPRKLQKGTVVLSGSKLISSEAVYVRAQCNANESKLLNVLNRMRKANEERAFQELKISPFIDKIAKVFVPTVLALAFSTGLGWFFLGPTPVGVWVFKSVVSVLLMACPCVFGLATPISATIWINFLMARLGILVNKSAVLENAADVDVVIYDKTGTLTKESIDKIEFSESSEKSNQEILSYVASLERNYLENGNNHPFAHLAIDRNETADFYGCTDLKLHEHGISGTVQGREVVVGEQTLLNNLKIKISPQFLNTGGTGAASVKYVAVNGVCKAAFFLSHAIRPEAKEDIRALRAMGIQVCMLTGDNAEVAKQVAKQLNLEEEYVFAGRTREQKEDIVKSLQTARRGSGKRIVAMVGDGLNDTNACNTADVAISVGPFTDIAPSAHLVLKRLNVSECIKASREVKNNIYQNLFWAGFYNFFSLAAATGVFYLAFGLMINPVVASLSMAFSSVFVVFNSSRLAYHLEEAFCARSPVLRSSTYLEKATNFCLITARSFVRTLKMFFFEEEEEEGFTYFARKEKSVGSPQKKFALSSGTTLTFGYQPTAVKESVFKPAIKNAWNTRSLSNR